MPPNEIDEMRKVSRPDVFLHSRFQLGDFVTIKPQYYQRNPQQVIQTGAGNGNNGVGSNTNNNQNNHKRQKGGNKTKNSLQGDTETVMVVVKTRCVVDVEWQDGIIEKDISSCDLIPRIVIDDNDFWPKDFVAPSDHSKQNEYPLGQVLKVNYPERTALVQWFGKDAEDLIEEVSVYEIKNHEGYNFQLFDWIMRVSPFEQSLPNSDKKMIDEAKRILERVGPIPTPKHEKGTGPNPPRIGQVASILNDGNIVVVWHNEKYSIMTPECLLMIDTEDIEDYSMGGYGKDDDDDDSQKSWETYDGSSDSDLEGGFNDGENNNQNENEIDNDKENENEDEDEDEDEDEGEGENENENKTENTIDNENVSEHENINEDENVSETQIEDNQDQLQTVNNVQTEHQLLVKTNDLTSGLSDLSIKFKSQYSLSNHLKTLPKNLSFVWQKFAITEETPIDHHFANTPLPFQTTTLMRRLQTEFKLLESSLPEGVYVRAFEDRCDLFRVMIIGPKDTPYENGMFLFDFHLPQNYPMVPPNAFFHSWTDGLGRLNPNLYEDGKICLSLLGTWVGKGNEIWNSQSNLLQLLISLQGLVLVREPYYNEAGYEKQVGSLEGEENSKLYNEKAFILTIRSTLWILRHPPKPFYEEIHDYYITKQNLGNIIKRCENLIPNKDKDKEKEESKAGTVRSKKKKLKGITDEPEK